ncbi:hypothetical protein HY772_10375 [Candidatus Woesearchaeota archaeon]|nr:hypothetical protein [Candidatus Woesearchaeota archaeon]
MTKYSMDLPQLLSLAPEGSEERKFWQCIFEILEALNLPKNQINGIAVIFALELAEIIFNDGRHLGGVGMSGGIEDLCTVVAVVFSAVNPDPTYWKSKYPSEIGNPDVQEVAYEINQKIQNLNIVDKFIPWIECGSNKISPNS